MTLELELSKQVNSVLGQITVTTNLNANNSFRAYLVIISKALAALSCNPLGVWNHLGMKKRVLWETRKRKTNLRSRRMGKKIFSFWPNLLRFIFVSTVAKKLMQQIATNLKPAFSYSLLKGESNDIEFYLACFMHSRFL